MSAYDEFMLLERKPLLTQPEQDQLEAMQYGVCIEAPVILSEATCRKNHRTNVFAGDFSPKSAPASAPRVKVWYDPLSPPPGTKIVRGADGIREYHIDLCT